MKLHFYSPIIFVKCLIVVLLLEVQCHSTLLAQDQTYAQYFNQKVYLNPAMAGYEGGLNAGLTYRKQWFGLEGTNTDVVNRARFDSYMASFDVDLPCFNLALGGYASHNELGQGYYSQTSLGGSLVVALPISNRKIRFKRSSTVYQINEEIRFGIGGSYNRRQQDFGGLTFTDQFDAIQGLLTTPSGISLLDNGLFRPYGDVSAGLVYSKYGQNSNLRLSVAAHHLISPEISFLNDDLRLPMRFTFEAVYSDRGGSLPFGFTPMIRADFQRGVQNQNVIFSDVQMGIATTYEASGYEFWAGLMMRGRFGLPDIRRDGGSTNTLIFMTGINLGPTRFTISYGIPNNGLGTPAAGNVEASINFHIAEPRWLSDCCVRKHEFGRQF